MRKLTIHPSYSLTLIAVCALALLFRPDHVPTGEMPAVEGPSRAAGGVPDSIGCRAYPPRTAQSAFVSEGIMSWCEPGFRQEYTVRNRNEVRVTNQVSTAGSGAWVASEVFVSTTPAQFHLFDSARKDVFCFGGHGSTGNTVIEIWRLVPAPPVPPPAFAPSMLFSKKQVYRGPLGATGLIALEIDDQERFLLLLVDDGQSGRELYRIDLPVSGGVGGEPSPAPYSLLSSVAYPGLLHTRWITKYDHASLGRVWKLEDAVSGYTHGIFLIDTDNNGVFDGSPLVGSYSQMASMGLEHPSSWHSLTGP